MKFLRSLLIALLFLLAITFSLQNNELVTIKYYTVTHQRQFPLYLLVFICVMFGIIVGGFEGMIEKVRTGGTIRKLKKELEAKEKELTSLRNLPITESTVPADETKDDQMVLNES